MVSLMPHKPLDKALTHREAGLKLIFQWLLTWSIKISRYSATMKTKENSHVT
jgi:hypothetical protein